MKYQKEYETTRTMKEFIALALKNYPDIKKATAERNYYRLNKNPNVKKQICVIKEKNENKDLIILHHSKNEPTNLDNFDAETQKPDMFKILTFNDIVKYGKNIDKKILLRYGFTMAEIKWLHDEGYIEGRKFINID